jgi:hypothetical protein
MRKIGSERRRENPSIIQEFKLATNGTRFGTFSLFQVRDREGSEARGYTKYQLMQIELKVFILEWRKRGGEREKKKKSALSAAKKVRDN